MSSRSKLEFDKSLSDKNSFCFGEIFFKVKVHSKKFIYSHKIQCWLIKNEILDECWKSVFFHQKNGPDFWRIYKKTLKHYSNVKALKSFDLTVKPTWLINDILRLEVYTESLDLYQQLLLAVSNIMYQPGKMIGEVYLCYIIM